MTGEPIKPDTSNGGKEEYDRGGGVHERERWCGLVGVRAWGWKCGCTVVQRKKQFEGSASGAKKPVIAA